MREQEVVIGERFRGPPDSGNGGFVCGLVATALGEPGEVTLRRPPPLERSLRLRRTADGVALVDGDLVVAEAIPTAVQVKAPEPVGVREAQKASEGYEGFAVHPFPTCFVCGPERKEGDGLRIFPGPVQGRNVVAAPWTPDDSVTGRDGLVRPEFLWAALDCPGAFASGVPEVTMVLGRLAARAARPLEPGAHCVVMGWSESVEGRKAFAGTALYTARGELIASARATWIRVA